MFITLQKKDYICWTEWISFWTFTFHDDNIWAFMIQLGFIPNRGQLLNWLILNLRPILSSGRATDFESPPISDLTFWFKLTSWSEMRWRRRAKYVLGSRCVQAPPRLNMTFFQHLPARIARIVTSLIAEQRYQAWLQPLHSVGINHKGTTVL